MTSFQHRNKKASQPTKVVDKRSFACSLPVFSGCYIKRPVHRVDPPFVIIAPALPNGPAAGLHLAISDATGDSHIFVYVKVKLFIHHGRQYKVMTNFPTFDEQLALNAYWNNIGGNRFMPGTINAADRFVRTTCYLNSPRNTKLPNLRWLGHSRRSECSACPLECPTSKTRT